MIGVPDALRGEVVKAFVVARDAARPRDGARSASCSSSSATRLAAYEYPREIEFVDELPLTVTGKIRRAELRRTPRRRNEASIPRYLSYDPRRRAFEEVSDTAVSDTTGVAPSGGPFVPLGD